MLALRDKFLGCLLGGALGDALGYTVEFVRVPEDLTRLAASPEKLWDLGQGLVSDDTQMALFSAEALLRARAAGSQDVTRFALGAYQRWYTTQQMTPGVARACNGQGLLLREPRLHARRAPGNTCLGALAFSFTQDIAPSVEHPPNFSKGCGAVMRAAPFGLWASSREQAFFASRDAAVLTHGHPSGFLSAAYLATLVFDVTRGMELPLALPLADALLAREPEHEELARLLQRARLVSAAATPAELVAELGEGWVGEEALAIGLACALSATADAVPSALWRSVAHVGDSDSTGSIAGNLIGARFGAGALPARWLQKLELRDLIERIAVDLLTEEVDLLAYPPVSGVFERADMLR